jgi:hypothetical protein
MDGMMDEIEELQRSFFQNAVVGKKLENFQWEIAQLPFRYGGWNFVPPRVLSICAFLASLNSCSEQVIALRPEAKQWVQTQLERVIVLFKQLNPSATTFEIKPTTTQSDLVNHVMEAKYQHLLETLPEDLQTLLYCESRAHASAWKPAPPKADFMSDVMDFQIQVRRSLRVPIIPTPILCPKCKTHVMNVYGDHAVHCPSEGVLVARHNGTSHKVVLPLRAGLIGAIVETKVILSETESYRPDITLSEPIPGLTQRKTAMDITIANPFASYMIKRTSKGPLVAALNGTKRKVKENKERLDSKGYDFLALSFEATGGCTEETEQCLLYILSQKAIVHNLQFSEVCSEFWQSLSCFMQRANARAIRERVNQPRPVRYNVETLEDDSDLQDDSVHDDSDLQPQ